MKKKLFSHDWLKFQNSLSFWEQRLTENKIPFNKKRKSLHFSDPDDTHIVLTEVPENPLKETLVVLTTFQQRFKLSVQFY